ncbi:MAG: YbaK/EbsC family protein [Crocosphaera sp.]
MSLNLTEATPQTEKIISLLNSNNIDYQHIHHPECRTSSQSAEARAKAGGGFVIGAKAILMKVERKTAGSEFYVFVLPGDKQINSKILKKSLKRKFEDFNRFRFSTVEEMAEQTEGLVPGTMPPFAQPIFDKLAHLFIDTALLDHQVVGFNAACLTQSLIVPTQDYIKVASPTDIFSFSS